MKLLEKIIDKIDDGLNPIVVKELRQAVQSRFVIGIFMLFLISLLCVTGTAVLFRIVENKVTAGTGTGMGRDIFEILFYALTISSMFFVPAYTGIRMGMERSETYSDLVFISSVKPGAIIRGKLFAGIIITLLLFSVCMPFMTFTYLLRGIDIISVFAILATVFIATVVCIHFTLFMGCIPCSRLFKSVLAIASTAVVTFFCAVIIEDVSRYRFRSVQLWDDAYIFLFLAGVFTVFCYVSAVAAISPSSANRVLGIRLCLSSVWLITGIIPFFTTDFKINEWIGCSVAIVFTGLLLSVSEKDGQSLRVRRSIPHGKIKRTAAFFFYSGAANGIAWIFVIAALTLCLGWFIVYQYNSITYLRKFFHSYSYGKYIIQEALGICLYIYCYSVSGLLIRRKFFYERIQSNGTWVIALMVCALSCIAPYIIVLLTVHHFDGMRYMLLFGDMFDIDRQKIEYHIMFAGSWAIILTIVSLPWFVRQIRRFVPLADS
ncbi:MAG: hypothetical protein GY749_16925 [Desulfobacteraceae bacterium]|nr:hypothetical protein [Desulfobacteraceae bacterium]